MKAASHYLCLLRRALIDQGYHRSRHLEPRKDDGAIRGAHFLAVVPLLASRASCAVATRGPQAGLAHRAWAERMTRAVGAQRGVYDIYWGDYRMQMLSPKERWALQRGQITPREAREIYELACFLGPPLQRETPETYAGRSLRGAEETPEKETE